MPQKTKKSQSNEELYQEYLDTKNEQILDQITLQNKYYIRSLATSIYEANYVAVVNNCIIEKSDLEQEGYLGFRVGLQRYDITSGNKVITYCKQWALKYMRELYEKHEKLVRVPQHIGRIAVSGGLEDDEMSSYKAIAINAFSKPTVELQAIENLEEKTYKANIEYEYLRLITSEFSEKELMILNSLWEDGVSVFKSNVYARHLISKISNLYKTIKKQAVFTVELDKRGECIMSLETYNFWLNGFVGDKVYQYKAIDVFLIEKERYDFEVFNHKQGIILKIN